MAALELDHVSKRFRIGRRAGLLDALLRRRASPAALWALRDISLRLEQGPFRAGDAVEVIVLAASERRQAENPYPLRGAPIRYDDPMEPVAESDWDALK